MSRELQQPGAIPHIIGLGRSVGGQRMLNADLDGFLGRDPGFTGKIMRISGAGMEQRYWIVPGEQVTSDLLSDALREALDDAKIRSTELSAVFIGTTSPDFTDGSIAGRVQVKAELPNRIPISTNADACSGGVYALHRAIATMTSPFSGFERGPVGVTSGDVISQNVSPKDPQSSVLFGDAAGAVILDFRTPAGGADRIGAAFDVQGEHADAIIMEAGGTQNPPSHETIDADMHRLHIEGKEVFEAATQIMPDVGSRALGNAGLTVEDVSYLIPHHANQKMMLSAATTLGIPVEKVRNYIAEYGNTSAASVLTALWEADRRGELEKGRYMLLVAAGGGMNGAGLVMPTPIHS